jgi:soluble lytic murein transglycosylase-like protein
VAAGSSTPHRRLGRNALTIDEAEIMDLTTLVTACAFAVDPKVTHALIWHQSGGEPWSFTVAGVHQPQIFRDVSDALDAAHDTYPADVTIRIGLTGLSATPRSVAAAMFAPCSNITLAARQIADLAERCKTSSHSNHDPIYCAIAAYRGSRERPDNAFADAVRTSVANNDAPDFEMPARTDVNAAEIRSARQPASHDTAMAPPAAPDDRERARLSPLFPVKSRPSERPPIDDAAGERPAVQEQKSDVQSARPTPAQPLADGLFVPRSAQRTSP